MLYLIILYYIKIMVYHSILYYITVYYIILYDVTLYYIYILSTGIMKQSTKWQLFFDFPSFL